MNFREYRYVGSQEVLNRLPSNSERVLVQTPNDVINWITQTNQPSEYSDLIVATFIIDLEGALWINIRRSEHFLCAAGQHVLSAGEMSFRQNKNTLEVAEVTNQSTGYCPEPESWLVVERALTRANIAHPPDFTTKYIFRRCEYCGSTNLVKDDWFECGVCQTPLPVEWNFDSCEQSNS